MHVQRICWYCTPSCDWQFSIGKIPTTFSIRTFALTVFESFILSRALFTIRILIIFYLEACVLFLIHPAISTEILYFWCMRMSEPKYFQVKNHIQLRRTFITLKLIIHCIKVVNSMHQKIHVEQSWIISVCTFPESIYKRIAFFVCKQNQNTDVLSRQLLVQRLSVRYVWKHNIAPSQVVLQRPKEFYPNWPHSTNTRVSTNYKLNKLQA